MRYVAGMTISNITPLPDRSSFSRVLAAEIRAEMGRQGVSQRTLARQMGVTQMWMSRRIGVTGDVDITFEEAEKMAEALRMDPKGLLLAVYAIRDSNPEPAD